MNYRKVIVLKLSVKLTKGDPPPRDELKEMIRRQTTGWKKEPCYICGGHALITELHHVMPVNEIASLIENEHLERGKKESEWPLVLAWLCPNHHRYLHTLGSDTYLTNQLGEAERAGYHQLRDDLIVAQMNP